MDDNMDERIRVAFPHNMSFDELAQVENSIDEEESASLSYLEVKQTKQNTMRSSINNMPTR
jgi:hypothetical protein